MTLVVVGRGIAEKFGYAVQFSEGDFAGRGVNLAMRRGFVNWDRDNDIEVPCGSLLSVIISYGILEASERETSQLSYLSIRGLVNSGHILKGGTLQQLATVNNQNREYIDVQSGLIVKMS